MTRHSLPSWFNRLSRLLVLVMLAGAMLEACSPEPTVPPPAGPATDTPVPLPTATPPPPTALPTAVPVEVPRTFVTYRHPSGVFMISLPDDWETLDDSNDRRLLTRLIPPIGFGSRVTIDITNEGPLSAEEVRNLAESYIHLHYAPESGYTEVSRAELPDGRLQVVFFYNDNRGASGRETLTIEQVGAYFVALRVFLSDKDTFHLSGALETMASSFSVDSSAVWGTRVAAINPAELAVVNTSLWRDAAGLTHYMGEVYNASSSDITSVQVRVAFCNNVGAVIAEAVQPTALERVKQGGSSPFSIVLEDMPADVTVCSAQPSAEPAQMNPFYISDLELNTSAGFADRQLVVQGQVTNRNLLPIHNIQIIVAIYNAQNQIIGLATFEAGGEARLEPGQSLPFQVVFSELGGEADHFMTVGQATAIRPSNPSLIPTATP